MPRAGHNPMKKHGQVYQAEPVTLATTVFIPELTGYWKESLDVLKVCLNSVFENTDVPYDLLVFDNGSCVEVREYLLDLHAEGNIQFLFLALGNIGKVGCFNQVFPGSPGEYIAFFDSDVYFYPGWLSTSLKVFETFDNVGMVTARPGRDPVDGIRNMSATHALADEAKNGLVVERGELIPNEVLSEHFVGLGYDRDFLGAEREDVKLTLGDISAYVFCSHFQFVTRRSIAVQILPIPLGGAPLTRDAWWDQRLDSLGYLRLSLDRPYVRHMGNSLKGEPIPGGLVDIDRPTGDLKDKSAGIPRRVLLKLHSWLTKVLYS